MMSKKLAILLIVALIMGLAGGYFGAYWVMQPKIDFSADSLTGTQSDLLQLGSSLSVTQLPAESSESEVSSLKSDSSSLQLPVESSKSEVYSLKFQTSSSESGFTNSSDKEIGGGRAEDFRRLFMKKFGAEDEHNQKIKRGISNAIDGLPKERLADVLKTAKRQLKK